VRYKNGIGQNNNAIRRQRSPVAVQHYKPSNDELVSRVEGFIVIQKQSVRYFLVAPTISRSCSVSSVDVKVFVQ